jgi:hypothetical protein
MSKISQLPALTGAQLANGDLFPVVDVGSPNSSEYITADELAQGSQFSSRFVPKSGDELFISAGAMSADDGSPSESTLATRWSAWLLDADSLESVTGGVFIPSYWASYHVDFVFGQNATGSGDVVLSFNVLSLVDGTDAAANWDGPYTSAAITCPAQHVVKRSRIATSLTHGAAGKPVTFQAVRAATNAGDTLPNDIALVGLVFTRAS